MQSFKESLVNGVLVSILLHLLGIIFWKLYDRILIRKSVFDLSGFWSNFHKNYKNDEIIEFYLIRQQGRGKLFIKIWQYKKERQKINKYAGHGCIISERVSLYYCTADKYSNQTGAMVLRILDSNVDSIYLEGTYYEMNQDSKSLNRFYEDGFLKLYRINFTFFDKVCLFFKKGKFKEYDSARLFLK